MSTNDSRTIIVTGATGKQGRALIESAISTTDDIRIIALTRDVSSRSAQSLKNISERVHVVAGNLDDPDSVRAVFQNATNGSEKVWGVFVVLAYPGLGADASGEERQGILLADLANEFGVEHFIYSSAERGGKKADDEATLSRLAKVRIERHIQSLSGLRWTILRPTFFMENFDGTIGSITTTVMRLGLAKETKIHLIAAGDIGRVALAVFQAPVQNANKAITVIGDFLSPAQMNDVCIAATQKPMPSIPNIAGRALIAINKHTKELTADIDRMYRDRQSNSETAEEMIGRCRELYPDMQSFDAWVKARGLVKDRKENWNNVTIFDLITGKR